MVGRVVLIALLAGTWPGVARAQTAAVELRGGYAYVADADFNFPFGFYADIGVPVSPSMSVVAEIGHSRANVVEFGVPVTLSVTSYQGGVRLEARRGRVRPYVNAIGGVTRLGGGVNVGNLGGVRGLDVNVSALAFTIQPGGGVVIPLSDRVGLALGGDYRWGAGDLGSVKEFRFTSGVVFGLGNR